MTSQHNINIARAWFKAFNEHNLEALLTLFDENILHYSPKLKVRRPETGGYARGKAELRAWWQGIFDTTPTLRFKTISITAHDERVVLEYIRQANGEPDLHGAEVLEIKDALIVASRVYHG